MSDPIAISPEDSSMFAQTILNPPEPNEALRSAMRSHTGIMAEMNDSGDTKVLWDKDNPDEVANAKATFERLTKDRKFAAFTVKKNGEQGERILAFDPEAERIILVPQLRGG